MAKQLQKQAQEPYDAQKNDREFDTELADVIYMFLEEGGKGIRLYDRTDDVHTVDLAKELEEGEFITDTAFDEVEWDRDVNIPNGAMLVRYREGSRKETTYIVSEEKMQEVLSAIEKAKDARTKYFTINAKDEIIENADISEEEKAYFVSSNKDDKTAMLQDDKKRIASKGDIQNKKDDTIKKITPKDIAEVDVQNKISSSEIYEANKHLFTHKEYKNYIDN